MEDITVIYKPSVFLVGEDAVRFSELEDFFRQENIPLENVSQAPSHAEGLIETAGRVCYMSFAKPRPGGNQAYIKRILESAHGSVLEHGVCKFIITGISRSLTHELVRHRAGFAYSQLSQRYVDESNTAFVVPPEYLSDSVSFEYWKESCRQSLAIYTKLVDHSMEQKLTKLGKTLNDLSQDERTQIRKEVRQAARSVLPNCTETKIFVTANFRALRHFLEMRASFHADVEICRLANMMFDVLVHEYPNVFDDYLQESKGNVFQLTTNNRKV